MCFGIILGWVIGTQQAAARATAVQLQQAAPHLRQPRRAPRPLVPRASASSTREGAKPADDHQERSENAGAQIQLANTYFDAGGTPMQSCTKKVEARPEVPMGH